jgi:hypothetical protein
MYFWRYPPVTLQISRCHKGPSPRMIERSHLGRALARIAERVRRRALLQHDGARDDPVRRSTSLRKRNPLPEQRLSRGLDLFAQLFRPDGGDCDTLPVAFAQFLSVRANAQSRLTSSAAAGGVCYTGTRAKVAPSGRVRDVGTIRIALLSFALVGSALAQGTRPVPNLTPGNAIRTDPQAGPEPGSWQRGQ